MAKRIKDTTRDYLKSIPLPVQTASYTVISHESVMDYAAAEIAAQGFSILSEHYRCTGDGQIAQGVYKLSYNSDPELSLMFAWSNSYNKQIRFRCATGAFVNDNNTVMLCGEIGTWARKHTGTADAETIQMIKDQFTNAQHYYDTLVNDKETMKGITLTTKRQAELLGVLFAEDEILSTEQASIVKQQIEKPSFFYNGGVHTLWAFYNHVTVALQQAHPKTWMEDQRMLHWFISNEFDLSTPAPQISTPVEVTEPMVDPLDTNYGQPENQTNLLVQIAEVTGDDSVLQAQPFIIEEDVFKNIAEVTAQAIKDELTFGISGVAVSADGLRNVPIDEVLDEMQSNDEQYQKDIVQYTDPAGNTFEAPVVEEKLSLDDILIRIPNEEKKKATEVTLEPEIDESTLSPFQKMQLRLERANKRAMEEQAKAEEVEEEDIENTIEEISPVASFVLTPEEMEEHKEELDQLEAQLEVTSSNPTEVEEVKSVFSDDFSFDLSSNDEESMTFDDDFL